ncbi:MAG: DUF3047 domain-containing protein [Oligoflexus sp.]
MLIGTIVSMRGLIGSIILLASCSAFAQGLDLKADQFQTIHFNDIAQTRYHFKDGTLQAEANQSSSVLIHAFDSVRKVSELSFEWYGEGSLGVRDAKHEASKSGDDAWLRIGLMVHGAAPTIPFFAPAWIKQTREALKLPSNRMVYLVAGSQHEAGSQWESPYSSSIRSIALASKDSEDKPWQKSQHHLDEALDIVGIWLMVDSDNTKGKIKTHLRNLQLK